jgi:hypothetical protein
LTPTTSVPDLFPAAPTSKLLPDVLLIVPLVTVRAPAQVF